MREIPLPAKNVTSLLEAFNFIGRRIHDGEWSGHEAAAIRLGQRSNVAPDARRRGQEALNLMRHFAEDGLINLIYTDHCERRVPYFQHSTYWLSAIYPDPVGTGEGMLELDNGDINPCVADTSGLKKWSSTTPSKVKPGPKRRFLLFDMALDDYFAENPSGKKNGEVTSELGKLELKIDWPGNTIRHERINEARNRAIEKNRSAI